MNRLLCWLLFAWMVVGVSSVWAEDWPAYKHDGARSAVTAETLALTLKRAWNWQGAPPAPAWGEPGRSLNPLDFDYAPHPVIADGLLVIASSCDDTVRAFDLK